VSRDPELAHRITLALDAEREFADRIEAGRYTVTRRQLIEARNVTDAAVQQVGAP
jgi:hypothetical protein